MENNTKVEQVVPKVVFIVPYRDRKHNMNIFNIVMKHIMEDYDDNYYKIYFAHQKDDRPFNRGAMKNVGFLAIKEKYPNDYQDITFVFNDVDTVPCEKGLINYETTRGTIKHFYGFKFALGGIFSITGFDFELLNGFPCYWSWGYEDNVLNTRAMKWGLTIDRTTFFKIGDPAILQTVDSFVKSVNRRHKEEMRNDNFTNGVRAISNISYEFDDNFININSFEPAHRMENEQPSHFNLMANKYIGPNQNRNPSVPMFNQSSQQETQQFQQAQRRLQQPQQPQLMNLQRHKFIRRGGLAFFNK